MKVLRHTRAERKSKPMTERTSLDLTALIAEFIVYLEAVRTLSPNSVTAYKSDLERFKNFLGEEKDIRSVGAEDIRFCIAQLSKAGKAATSVNRFIASVRSFFAYCRKFNYIEGNPALAIKSVRTPKLMPRFLTGAEIDELCDEPRKNELLWETRDAAIFELLYSSGCRVSELAALKKSDFGDDFSSAIVKGKGGKDRRVYFGKDAQNALLAYLSDRKRRFADARITDEEKVVFVNQRGGGFDDGRDTLDTFALYGCRRNGAARLSARISSYVCNCDACRRRRCPHCSGNAGTFEHFNDAAVHAHNN